MSIGNLECNQVYVELIRPFDPMQRANPEELNHALATYCDIPEKDNPHLLTGALLCHGTFSARISPDRAYDLALELPQSESEVTINALGRIVTAAEEHAEAAIDQLQKDDSVGFGPVSAMLLEARDAHAPHKRRTGKPYVSHPEAVAAMLNGGIAIAAQKNDIEHNKQQAILCAGAGHDIDEMAPKDPRYFHQNWQHHFSGLARHIVLSTVGNVEIAVDTNHVIRKLNHNKKGSYGMHWLPNKVEQNVLIFEDALSTVVKDADVNDNHIMDPMPPSEKTDAEARAKAEAKRAFNTRVYADFLEQAPLRITKAPGFQPWMKAVIDAVHRYTPSDMPELTDRFNEYIQPEQPHRDREAA